MAAADTAAKSAEGFQEGRLIGIDQDAEAIAAATERLEPFREKGDSRSGIIIAMHRLW